MAKSKSEENALAALRAATSAAPVVEEKVAAPEVEKVAPRKKAKKKRKVSRPGAEAATSAVIEQKEKELSPLPHNIRLQPKDSKLVDDICDLIRGAGKRRPSMADAIRVALRSFDMEMSSSEIEGLLPEYFNK